MSNLKKDLKEILSNDNGDLDEIDKSVESNDKIERLVEEVNEVNEVNESVNDVDESIELSNDLIDSLIDDAVLKRTEVKEPKKEKKEPSLFDREWIKLEKGMKLNRINLFIKKQKEDNGLNDTQTKSLKDILFKACNDGMLNKMCDVTYKDEEVQSIRNLEFNEQTKKYKLKTSSSKHRVNVKSRSNIDRFMKK